MVDFGGTSSSAVAPAASVETAPKPVEHVPPADLRALFSRPADIAVTAPRRRPPTTESVVTADALRCRAQNTRIGSAAPTTTTPSDGSAPTCPAAFEVHYSTISPYIPRADADDDGGGAPPVHADTSTYSIGAPDARCWWCHHDLGGAIAVPLPLGRDARTGRFALAEGTHCSWSCARARAHDRGQRDSIALLWQLRQHVEGGTTSPPTQAPHFSRLRAYGGAMSIEQFREGLCRVRPDAYCAMREAAPPRRV